MAALGDENVGGLDVAMHDSSGVRRVQSIGHLDSERQDQLGFHRSAGDMLLQRQAIQKLHGDERIAVLVVNFVDRADIRMIQ